MFTFVTSQTNKTSVFNSLLRPSSFISYVVPKQDILINSTLVMLINLNFIGSYYNFLQESISKNHLEHQHTYSTSVKFNLMLVEC